MAVETTGAVIESDLADLIDKAIASVLDKGLRTADIASGGKAISTTEMGDAILAELKTLHA